MGLIVAGLVTVSAQSMLEARSKMHGRHGRDKSNDVAIGIVLMVISQFVLACLGIQEEFILRNSVGANPMLMMGWQGVWGLVLSGLALVPLHLAKCPFPASKCVNGRIEDFRLAYLQFKQEPSLFGFAVVFIINCTVLNASGAYVMHHASVVNRSIFRQLSIILIWVFFLCYTGTGHERFSLLQLAGYLVVLAGVIGFNLADWRKMCKRQTPEA